MVKCCKVGTLFEAVFFRHANLTTVRHSDLTTLQLSNISTLQLSNISTLQHYTISIFFLRLAFFMFYLQKITA